MAVNPLNTFGTVKLDGSGNGSVKIGPIVRGQVWDLTVAAVSTNTNTNPAANVPQVSIFIGPAPTPDALVDGTYSGSLNSTTNVSGHPITVGNYIWAVFAGGDPNSIATLSIWGTVTDQRP